MRKIHFIFFQTNYFLKKDSNNFQLLIAQRFSLKLWQASRLKQVSDQLDTLSSFCSVLGLDVKDKICEICPTMTSTVAKDLSDQALKSLTSEVQNLRGVKMQRMQKVSILAHAFQLVKNQLYSARLSKFS